MSVALRQENILDTINRSQLRPATMTEATTKAKWIQKSRPSLQQSALIMKLDHIDIIINYIDY